MEVERLAIHGRPVGMVPMLVFLVAVVSIVTGKRSDKLPGKA
jgi:hypothetical protein